MEQKWLSNFQEIASITKELFICTFSTSNNQKNFQKCGLWPVNSIIFSDIVLAENVICNIINFTAIEFNSLLNSKSPNQNSAEEDVSMNLNSYRKLLNTLHPLSAIKKQVYI